jgi:hypothetical protein
MSWLYLELNDLSTTETCDHEWACSGSQHPIPVFFTEPTGNLQGWFPRTTRIARRLGILTAVFIYS